MHYRSLLTVEMPTVEEDIMWEKGITHALNELAKLDNGKPFDNFFLRMRMADLVNVQTNFGYELNKVIRDIMERFYVDTEDMRYLEFWDRTDEYTSDFNERVDCIKTADGKIYEVESRYMWNKYLILDGVVYQQYAGPLRHPKRTKSAKRMKAILNYERNQLYKSFDQYVTEEREGRLNQETGRYGLWYNPDGVYDWYRIGGRWPAMFLIRKDCREYSLGERQFLADEKYPAPDGYRWVCAARKKDIQWEVMRNWRNQKATERFHQLEEMFLEGIADESIHGEVYEWGITDYGDVIYREGETLEEYLNEYGIPETWKYPFCVSDIFSETMCLSALDAQYDCCEDSEQYKKVEWQTTFEDYIDNVDDNTVFVGIDYHI